jgi:hypothetical protein
MLTRSFEFIFQRLAHSSMTWRYMHSMCSKYVHYVRQASQGGSAVRGLQYKTYYPLWKFNGPPATGWPASLAKPQVHSSGGRF